MHFKNVHIDIKVESNDNNMLSSITHKFKRLQV